MFTIPENSKKPLKYAAIVIGIMLLLIAANETYKYLYNTLPPKLVSVTIKYLPESPCRKDTPIHMLVVNESYRHVVKASFTLAIKEDEGSHNLMPLSAGNYSTDELIEAGKSYEGCWSYPKLYNNKHAPESLMYIVKNQVIKFAE